MYRTIVIDPPWTTKRGPIHATNGKSRIPDFPTMKIDEIKALDIKQFADKNCHLYLWVTNQQIALGYEIAKGWGFKPSTMLTWIKKPMGIGLGGTYVITTEMCIFAYTGRCDAKKRIDTTWWMWKRGNKHAKKPQGFYDLVKTVSHGPYLDVFARHERPGWDFIGDELGITIGGNNGR